MLELVLEKPDDPATLRVYADWLQSRGDPRGALVAVQHARMQPSTPRQQRELKAQEQQLLREHHDALLGPLASLAGLSVAWRVGFVRDVEVEVVRPRQLADLVHALKLPQLALLERLTLAFTQLDALDSLIAALPKSLRHLGLRSVTGSDVRWEPVLEALPPLPSLAFSGGFPVSFDDLELKKLRHLDLAVDFEGLSGETTPKLETLTVAGCPGESIDWPESLQLLRVREEPYDLDDVELPERTLFDGLEADDLMEEFPERLARIGWGRAGERAFVVTDARGKGAPVRLGSGRFYAIELYSAEPKPDALKALAADLAAKGHVAIEVAVSNSNRDCLVRWPKGPLAMGPYRDRVRVFRAGVDHALGFDPGHTLDDVLLALDARIPTDELLPSVSPLLPVAECREVDEYGDAYDYEEGEGPIDWWATADEAAGPEPAVDAPPLPLPAEVEVVHFFAEEAEEEDEPEDEEPVDATTTDWDHVLAESPVDLEDDGSERNVDEGHDPDLMPFDADAVPMEEGAPCMRCGRKLLELHPCSSCHRDVCARCSTLEPDGETALCLRCR